MVLQAGTTATWTVVAPSVAAPSYLLNDVAALSPTEAWSVGQTQYHPLVARWDGEGWIDQPVAETARTVGAGLLGVDAVSSAIASVPTAIAVGGAYDRLTNTEIPLIQHWNGLHWIAADLDDGGYVLTGVAMTSATEAWAVGHGFPRSRVSGPVVLHWTPAGWTRGTPLNIAQGRLLAVATTAPDDVWAVGDADRRALILHYDGIVWRRTRVPRTPGPLTDVVALSSAEAWAVGGGSLLRWNGKAWRRVDDLPLASANTLSALSATDIWVAGGGGRLAHFDGHGWYQVGSPPPLSGTAVWLGSTSAAPGTVWVVGSQQHTDAPESAEQQVAVAEQQQP